MRLFQQFILRYLAKERVRSGTAIVGIALGIAVILAIRMANASSVHGFQAALETIAGKTSLEILGTAGGLDEKQLRALGWIGEYGNVSPVVEGDARIRLGADHAELLRVLGVDILRDHTFREYRLMEFSGHKREPDPQEVLRLLIDPGSIILTEKFARRHSLSIGQSVDLVLGDRVKVFTIRGLLRDAGPARVLDGNFALLDIAAAQWAFDYWGRLTRLDVHLYDASSINAIERSIAARLPPGLSVQRPSRRGREVEKMLEAFHFNLNALSYISLLVGLFLIYNTVSVSVIARRDEIGILRALGTGRRTIVVFFLSEALLLALVGCLLGLPLARLLAYGAVNLTSTTVSILYSGMVSPPPPLGFHDLVLALSMGLPLALLAAAAPALEASRVSPNDAMRGSDRIESRYRFRVLYAVTPSTLFLLGWWLSRFGPVNGLPIWGFVSALAFSFGGAFLTPAALYGLSRICRWPVMSFLKVEGRLAYANVAGSIPRLSVSVAALSLSLAMMVAIAVMVGSFRQTVLYWVGQTLQADLFLSSSLRNDPVMDPGISPEVERLVRSNPSVVAVDRFRSAQTPFGEGRIMVAYGDLAVLLSHGNLLFKTPSDGRSAVRAAIGQDKVLVSESFSIKHDRNVGDFVCLPTPRGTKFFRIAAVYYDYSNDRGTVMMDHATFVRYFGDLPPTGLRIYLKAGADADAVRDGMVSALDNRYGVFVTTNASLRREIMRVFDSTFAITYALEVIAVIVAVMGIAATLLTLILERRRELAVLRLLGTDRRQIRKMVVIEAMLMGIASQGTGIAVGMVLSLILIYVINVQSFGWTIQFHVPVFFLIQMSAVVALATAVSGIYPARCACEFEAVNQVVEE